MNADSLDPNKWIARAQMGFDVAVREAMRFRPSLEDICYHCQLTAEIILKAYILAQGSTPPKTHILKDLLVDCKHYSPEFDVLDSYCIKLTPYMTAGRYPSSVSPTENDMKQALNHAKQILDFTKLKLNGLGYIYTPDQTSEKTNNVIIRLKLTYGVNLTKTAIKAVNQAISTGLSIKTVYDTIARTVENTDF